MRGGGNRRKTEKHLSKLWPGWSHASRGHGLTLGMKVRQCEGNSQNELL